MASKKKTSIKIFFGTILILLSIAFDVPLRAYQSVIMFLGLGGNPVNAQGTTNVNVTEWDGSLVGAPSNYGTSPGAVAVPGVNAYVTNTVPVTGTFWQTTQPVSGTFWQATQPVSGTFWQTTQPVSLASLPALASGSNTIGAVTQASGPWTINLTQIGGATQSVTNPLFSEPTDGANAMGAMANYGTGPGSVKALNANAAVTQTVDPTATTSSTPANSVCLLTANTTAASCKASAGNVYGFTIYNPNSSLCVMQVFNTSSVTLGTTQELLDIPVLATGGNNIVLIHPINFSSDIYVASTTAAHGSSTCSTGMLINLFYE